MGPVQNSTVSASETNRSTLDGAATKQFRFHAKLTVLCPQNSQKERQADLAKSAELSCVEKVPHILDDVLALLRCLLSLPGQEQGACGCYLDPGNRY